MDKVPTVFIFFVAIIIICEPIILLYNTENGRSIEEFDCIYYTEISTVKYCARLGKKRNYFQKYEYLFKWKKMELFSTLRK